MPVPFTVDPLPIRPRGPLGLLADGLRRRGGRRGLSVVSVLLALAGVAMFAYPLYTDAQQRRLQQRLADRFNDRTYRQTYGSGDVAVGQGLTELTFDKRDLHVKVLVVEGTTPAALKAGAGHYAGTPLPGAAGNVGIAGHRTTYGRPFNRLDELGPGDSVHLVTPFDDFTYTVVPAFEGHSNPWVVTPTDYAVVGDPLPDHMLTLTTCNPKGSARERLVLRLRLNGDVKRS